MKESSFSEYRNSMLKVRGGKSRNRHCKLKLELKGMVKKSKSGNPDRTGN